MQPGAGYLHFPAAAIKLQALPAWQMMKKQKFASLRQPTTLISSCIAVSSASQHMTLMAISWCWWSVLAFHEPAFSDNCTCLTVYAPIPSSFTASACTVFGKTLPAVVLMYRQLTESKKHTADYFSFTAAECKSLHTPL